MAAGLTGRTKPQPSLYPPSVLKGKNWGEGGAVQGGGSVKSQSTSRPKPGPGFKLHLSLWLPF